MQKDSAQINAEYLTNRSGNRYIADIISPQICKRDYEELWGKRYGSLEFTSDQSYIFTGTDAGLLIKAFARHCIDQTLAIWFVEDERYIKVIADECRTQLASMSFVQLVTIDQLREQIDGLQFDKALLAGRVSALRASCAENDELGSYRPIDEQIKFLLESRRWHVLSSSVRLPYLQQRLRNIPEMTFPVKNLNGQLRGQTIVLLAAGPSLDDHLDWVKLHRENLFVICVSRISRRLLDVGINPDFVVLLDPHAISFEVSRDALSFDPVPILAFSDQGVNQIVGQWLGPKTYLGTRLPWKRESFETLTSAPTVSNLAFALACLLNPERIILLGLDFCLDEAGHTHARGCMERETGVSLRTDMEEVTTNDGSVRLSSVDYFNSGKHLEKQVFELARKIEVFNPSAGAMCLQGVSFSELNKLEQVIPNTQKKRREIRSIINQTPNQTQWNKTANKAFWAFKRDWIKFKELAKKGQSIVKKIDSELHSESVYLRKLDVIDCKIRNRYRGQRNFCVHTCGHLFADILDTGAEEGRDISEHALEKSGKIYQAYLTSMAILQSYLDETETLLRLRQTENDDAWSQELVDHFLDYALPGRVLATTSKLPKNARTTAVALKNAQLKMKTKRLQEVLDKMEVSEQSLFTTLNGAYAQKSLDKLIHYKNVIVGMSDFEHYKIYTLLAEAYLAEVLTDNKGAMDCYQAIIDQGESPLMEEALNRVAFLCIRTGDSNTALLALTVLSEVNPMYLATLEQFRKVA